MRSKGHSTARRVVVVVPPDLAGNVTRDEVRSGAATVDGMKGVPGVGSGRCWARPNERSELRPPAVAVRPEEARSDGDEW